MWSGNGMWNLLLFALGIFAAGVVWMSYSGTSTFLAQIAPAQQDFLVSGFEGSVVYTDDNGIQERYEGEGEIAEFCFGVLDR